MDYGKCEKYLVYVFMCAFVKDREAESGGKKVCGGGCVMIEKMSGWE